MARHRGQEAVALLREFQLNRDGALSMAQTRLRPEAARRLHRRTGVEEGRLHQMTLARYAGNALPHLPVSPWTDYAAVHQWRSWAWLSDHRARWCPKCLREKDLRWPLAWMLPWTFACLEHRVFMATECIRCLSPVHFGRHLSLDRQCQATPVERRRYQYGYDEPCEFPITLHRPLPVSDDSLLLLQERINAWLGGSPSVGDRQFVSVTAVMIMLVTPAMMLRSGEDPAIVCHLRGPGGAGLVQEPRPWADPLRVAAAACVARRLTRYDASPAEVARSIQDLRSVDHREVPWRLDAMDWAYGSALRPNAYVDELVRRGVITIGSFGRW